jgi:hypothetical protein
MRPEEFRLPLSRVDALIAMAGSKLIHNPARVWSMGHMKRRAASAESYCTTGTQSRPLPFRLAQTAWASICER